MDEEFISCDCESLKYEEEKTTFIECIIFLIFLSLIIIIVLIFPDIGKKTVHMIEDIKNTRIVIIFKQYIMDLKEVI